MADSPVDSVGTLNHCSWTHLTNDTDNHMTVYVMPMLSGQTVQVTITQHDSEMGDADFDMYYNWGDCPTVD